MESLSRLWPYLWAYKRHLFLSWVLAMFVAAFWGANLSAAFPVVKVLLQGQSLAAYVDEQIAQTETDIQQREESLKATDEQSGTSVETLQQRAWAQEHLSADSSRLVMLNWLKTSIVPWLPGDQFDTLALILGLVLLGTIVKGVLLYFQDILVRSVVERVIVGVRTDLFERVLKLDYQTISHKGTSDLMSRFTYDISLLAVGLTLLGGKVLREPLKAGVCILLAFWVNWQLTLLSLIFLPLAGILFYRFGRMIKRAGRRQMETMGRMYKTLEETFDGLKVVLAFNGKGKHDQRFQEDNEEYYQKAMKIAKIDVLTKPTTELLGILSVFVALLPGAYLVLRGTTQIWGITLAPRPLDIAQLSVLYVLLIGTLDPLRKLSSVYTGLKHFSAATDRLFKLADEETQVRETDTPKPFPRHAKQIEFRDIQFGYLTAITAEDYPRRPTALNDLSLMVKAGEVVALVGENGSGKSTLINLLPRFFDPLEGQVLVDGIDLRDVRLTDLRDQIGIVTQETLLFDGTILENIRYGCPEATRQQVEEAARRANVSQFVEQLPDSYETRVGEKGQKLSGGQRQRIALARAMLRNPAILILDEATSAIDSQSEALIHQSLETFVKGRTTFIITHSMQQSMLRFVTKICVMDQGQISMTGTHDTLIEQSPIYQRLFSNQVRKRSA